MFKSLFLRHIAKTIQPLTLILQVAAREQLEESQSTIDNLLDWLSHVDRDAERGDKKCEPAIKQNGNHFQKGDMEGLVGEDDEMNGNLLEMPQHNETHVDGQLKPTEDNLNKQYQKVKVLYVGTDSGGPFSQRTLTIPQRRVGEEILTPHWILTF